MNELAYIIDRLRGISEDTECDARKEIDALRLELEWEFAKLEDAMFDNVPV